MRILRNEVAVLIVVGAVLFGAGCRSSHQSIPIGMGAPPDSRVTVRARDGSHYSTHRGEQAVDLSRKSDYFVTFEQPGHPTRTTSLERNLNPHYALLVFGHLPGIVVLLQQAISGGIYDLKWSEFDGSFWTFSTAALLRTPLLSETPRQSYAATTPLGVSRASSFFSPTAPRLSSPTSLESRTVTSRPTSEVKEGLANPRWSVVASGTP